MRISIKTKIITYFTIIVLLTTIFFEAAMLNFIKYFYYSSIESILTNEIKLYSNLSELYKSDDLNDIILNDYDIFDRRTKSQFQLLSNVGLVLMDSIASSDIGNVLNTNDVIDAMNGNIGRYIGRVKYSDYNTMSITYPLKKDNNQIGIIRLTASLKDIDNTIKKIYIIFITFGIIVFILTIILSLTISRTIVKPIIELKSIASKIAQGNFNVKAKIETTDEISDLAKTMNFMTENILKKEQLKNDFISSVSHELRTPLTSIKGWAITLQGEKNPDNKVITEGLDIIEKESDRLTKMVEELLDFSRFVAGRISLQKEEVDLVSICKSIYTQFKIRAKNENKILLFEHENNEILLNADRNRIKQVLINLLDNSFKFSKENGIILIKLNSNNSNVFIEISDNGIGIKEEEVNLVINKFYTGSNKNSNIGLGLSIVDEIIKLHDGDITIKSIVGKGTKVKISLPYINEVKL